MPARQALPPGAYPVPYPVYVVLKPKGDPGLLSAGMGLTIAGVTTLTVGAVAVITSIFMENIVGFIAGGVLAGSGVILNSIGIPLWISATNKLKNPVMPTAPPSPRQVSLAPLTLPLGAPIEGARAPGQRPLGASITVSF